MIDRLEYELATVSKMGFVDYYLIVNDFVQYAKSEKSLSDPAEVRVQVRFAPIA